MNTPVAEANAALSGGRASCTSPRVVFAPGRRRVWAYPAIVAVFAATIIALIRIGSANLAPVQDAAAAVPMSHAAGLRDAYGILSQPLPLLLAQILVVILVGRLFGRAVACVGQPVVVGEILAGLSLGPSVLGAYFPSASLVLFPDASLPVLKLLGQVGVILFMFRIGLDLDRAAVRGHAHAAVAISHASILLPFLLGVLAAMQLYTTHAPAGIAFEPFALFVGVAMSITAFPVLARILEERRLSRTALGSAVLACAAVDDVTAWALLTVAVAVVSAGDHLTTAVVLTAVALFTVFMALAVRPVLDRVLRAGEAPGSGATAIVLSVLFASALTTEALGVHALFGAFLAGTVMPADERFRAGLRRHFESVGSGFLLPLFFVVTGLRTNLGLMSGVADWLAFAAIVIIAIAGKFAGSALTARLMGLDWNSALLVGSLMNTRGLMELIVLNIGYELGIIGPKLFAMFVLMALVTTLLTTPAIDFGLARRAGDPELDAVPL
jgi:Kef-type K+ transport system membrane component KefB